LSSGTESSKPKQKKDGAMLRLFLFLEKFEKAAFFAGFCFDIPETSIRFLSLFFGIRAPIDIQDFFLLYEIVDVKLN
jgi:hypothetical protein